MISLQTAPAFAQSSERIEVVIEAQPLSDALLAVAQSYDVSVIASEEVTRGRMAPRIEGTLTARAAIQRLLAGTDLQVRSAPNGGFLIVAVPNAITVYGLRDTTNKLDVTASVSITAGAEVEREPVVDLNGVLLRVPGVTTPGNGEFAIRGVNQRGPSGGTGDTLTIYLDDSPISVSNSAVGPFSVWDLEQVEVFRGPQSTNLGRNTLAGAIYIRTGDPKYAWDAKARAEVGNQDQIWGAVAFGGGLIDDVLAFRVAADYREDDGFVTNTFLGEDATDTKLWNTRFKLRFDPTPDFSVITSTSYSENTVGSAVLSPTNLIPDGPQLSAEELEPEIQQDLASTAIGTTFIQSVNATWQISDTLDLQSITTYQESTQLREADFDRTPANEGILITDIDDNAFTQELRLSFEGSVFKGVLGAYYADLDQGLVQQFITPANVIPGFGFLPPNVVIDRTVRPRTKTENFAIYGDGEIAVTDNVDLLVGARYDFEDLNIVSDQSVEASNVPPFLLPAFGTILGDSTEVVDTSFEAFLPKGGVRWRVADNARIAFVMQRAYRAGGSQINILTGALNDFDPEFLWNYELSARASLLDGALDVAANLYYSDWRDQQVLVQQPPPNEIVSLTENAGESELYGIELSASYEISSEISLYGGGAYNVAEFVDFPNNSFDPALPVGPRNVDNFAGNRFPDAPLFSLNAGIDYNGDDGVFGGIDVNHQSSAFTTPANLPTQTRDPFTLVNARIGYRISENFTVSAVARNLLDEDYFLGVTRSPEGDAANLGPPRNWAIRLDARF